MYQQKYNDLKLGERGAIISIIAYICLSALKLMVADLSNSEALKADGLNNTTDIIASIAVLIGLILPQRLIAVSIEYQLGDVFNGTGPSSTNKPWSKARVIGLLLIEL